MSTPVSVVLMNYLRPHNMSAVIRAWREQSCPPAQIVVVDNSPLSLNHEVYPSPVFAEANDVWRFSANHGCPGRLIVGLSQFDCPYVIFADDDLIPGSDAIKTLLEVKEQTCNRFATIGQVNRMFKFEVCNGLYCNASYDPRSSLPMREVPSCCDMTCRVHMVRSNLLHHAFEFRSQLLSYGARHRMPAMREMVNIHDDIMLALGIQKATGYPSFVIPKPADSKGLLLQADMDDAKGQWRRPGHFSQRTLLVQAATELGWRRPPIYNRTKGGMA